MGSRGSTSIIKQDLHAPAISCTQAATSGRQYPSTDHLAILAPASAQQVQWLNLPAELRERAQWAIAGRDKAPYLKGSNGELYHASPIKGPWLTFEAACAAAESLGLGIGIITTAEDGFCCIDMDVKDAENRDADGDAYPPEKWTTLERLKRYSQAVDTFDSYAELSASGKGIHIWIKGDIGKGARKDGYEVYSQERFIICTGQTVGKVEYQIEEGIARACATDSTPKPIRSCQRILEPFVEWLRGNGAVEESMLIEVHPTKSDDEILGIARRAKNAEKFNALWNGRWQEKFGSQSEADMALMSMLGFYSKSNEQCRRLFRQSALGKRNKAIRNDNYLDYSLKKIRGRQGVEEEQRRQVTIDLPELVEADKRRKKQEARSTGYFRLLNDNDLAQLPKQEWLVKKIIPDGGIGTIYGQSGTFKSFLALDLLAHISNGYRWFGHNVKAAPAVYVPFEGHGGIPNRVAAWRLLRTHQGFSGVSTNMVFITDRMNLRDQVDRDKLVKTLVDSGWAGGVLCIDTLAQAGAGIDENSSEGMGEMIAIFQELQYRLGGVVLVVHHSGKVEAAGMRGWSGLRGALDFSIKCQKQDGKKKLGAQFVLDKVKDDEDGKTFNFLMQQVVLGHDQDGDPITSLTVVPPVASLEDPRDSNKERDTDDDDFVWEWVRREVAAGNFPTGRSLEAQRAQMKPERDLTQRRLRDAIGRLKSFSRLFEEPGAPSGNKYLRAVEASKQE